MRIRQINIYRLVTVLFALLLFSNNATARYINMTEAWISMDEEKDGELGIIIHIDFTVNGIKGEPVQVTSLSLNHLKAHACVTRMVNTVIRAVM